MFGRLFLLFTLIPIIELYTLVQVGGVIGAFPTILVVIFTGAAGAWLARMEGFNTMLRVRESLNQGRMPADEMVEGLMILVAGIVLLTPGFITDFMGLILLFPPTRKPIARWLRKTFRDSAQVHGSMGTRGAGGGMGGNSGGFSYYSWHSSSGGKSGGFGSQEEQLRKMFDPEGYDPNNASPRQAVVIDCETVEEASEGESGSGKRSASCDAYDDGKKGGSNA